MSESNLRRAVTRWLKSQPDVWHVVTTGVSKAGTPDILCCVAGKFVAIELKTPTGRESKLQKYEGSKIQEAGGHYHVARSVQEVREVIHEVL